MRPALVVCLLVWSGVAGATPVEDACKALEKKAVAAAFPGAHAVLCKAAASPCAGLEEAACAKTAACVAKRGSGSGPGCSPCTPDVVFWSCEAASAEFISAQVLAFEACAQKQGTWAPRDGPFGSCIIPTGNVEGRIVNASADVVMRINGEEQPKLLRGPVYQLSLDANVETKLEVLDRKTGKVVAHTVTLKPKERRVLHFTFPK